MKRIWISFLLLFIATTAFTQQDVQMQRVPSRLLLLEKRDDGLINLIRVQHEDWWGYEPATAEDQKIALSEPDSVREQRMSGRLTVTGTDASARIIFRSIVEVHLATRLEWDEHVTIKQIPNPYFSVVVPDAVKIVEIEGWQPLSHATFNLDRTPKTVAAEATTCAPYIGQTVAIDPYRINVLVLAEGYEETAAKQFSSDVIDFTNRFYRTEPYKRYQSAFNIVSFFAHSCATGAFHPAACQSGASLGAPFWPTALHSHYCGDDVRDRDLAIDDNALYRMQVDLSGGHIPQITVVLVNDKKFGGSGGRAAVIAVRPDPTDPHNLNQYAPYGAMHEIGHSYGGLDDEYEENLGVGGGCQSNCKPNIMYSVGPPSVPKWSRWVGANFPVCSYGQRCNAPAGTPGAFEGAYRTTVNYWRPELECLMRHSIADQVNYTPPPSYYCHICTEQLIRVIYSGPYNAFLNVKPTYAAWTLPPPPGSVPPFDALKGKDYVLGLQNPPAPFGSGPDWTYTWHIGSGGGQVIPNETSSQYKFTPTQAGQYTYTLEVNDPTDMYRDQPPLKMRKYYTWKIPVIAEISTEDDRSLFEKVVSDYLHLPEPVKKLILHYTVQTSETNRLHGDSWHVAVTTPTKTLKVIQRTAFGPDDNTDATVEIPLDSSVTFPLTVQLEVGVKNGENSDGSEPFLPTVVTASLYGQPDGCIVSCDYCSQHPDDPTCPLSLGITVSANPIGDTSKTHNHGDSTYSSLGERIGEGRYVNITMPSFLTDAGMNIVEFVVEAVRPDNTVLAKVRDVKWYNGSTENEHNGIVWAPSAHAFVLNISPKRQYKDEGTDTIESGPYATGPHTDPIPESLWTHTMKYRITVKVTNSYGQVATSSAEIDSIKSPITPQQPNDQAERPLHALWHTPFSKANQNYWASLYMHNWLKRTQLPLHTPGEIADEDAVDSTASGHEYGSGLRETTFYGSSYTDFRANAVNALDSNTNATTRQDARNKIVTWINATRAHLEALLPNRAVSSVSVGDGGKCGATGIKDTLPDGWMKTLLMSSTITDSGGNVMLDLSGSVGAWNTAPLQPLYLGKLDFICNRNSDIDVLVDRCVIGENPLGPCNPSRHIKAPTAIITPPASKTIDPGGSAFLQVVADGTNVRYQWYQGALAVFDFPMIGETSDHITVSPAETTAYWVRVSGDDGVVEVGATVFVNGTGGPCTDPPTITSQPVSQQYITESGAAFMGVSATGTNPHYQWYLVDYFGETSIVGGQTLPTLTTTTLGSYFCRVSNGCGSVDSNRSDVLQGSNCLYPGSLVYPPSSSNITIGDHVDLSLFASGKPPIDVTWYEVMPDTGLPVPVVSGASVTVTPTNDPSKYLAILSNECGVRESSIVTINVCTPPAITTQPAGPATIVENSSFLLGVGATGSRLHYHWTANSAPYGTDSPNLIIGYQPVTTTYQCTIDNECGQVGSAAVVVSPPCPPISVAIQPASGSIISGQSIVLSATPSGTVTTYQWLVKVPGSGSFSDFNNATGTSLTVSPTVDGTQYAVRFGNGCSTLTSNPVTIAVAPCVPPSIVQTDGASIAAGQTSTIIVTAAGSDLHYAWYLGNPSNILNPLGGSGASLSMAQGIAGTRTYWVRVSGLCGPAVDSGPIVVHVCATPSIDVQPANTTVFSGQQATLRVTASEASGEALHYQWSFNGAPIGTDSPAYTTPPITQPGQYSVHVSSGICSTDSSIATVGVCTFPQTIVTGTTQNVAVGQSVTLSIGAITPATGNVYAWYAGPVGDFANSAQISNNSSPTYTFTAAAGSGGTYWATVSRSDDGCTSHTDAYTVNVCIPTITQPPAGLMINSGQTTTLTVVANTTGLTYQWYRGASGDTSAPVGTNSSSFTTPALTVATSYWVRVTGSCGQSVNSTTATITICQTPSITSQPSGISLVRGQSTTLTVAATGTNLTYQWYLGTSGTTSSPVGGNSNQFTATSPLNPVDYWVKVTGACGSAVNSNTAHISVCTTPTINTQPQSSTIFSGASATLSVSASEATTETMHYQWHRGTTSPVNVGTDSPTYNTGSLSSATSYYVTITAGTAGLCSVDSAAATVSICTYSQSVPGAPNANTSPGQSVRLTIPSNPGVTSYLWYRGTSGDTSSPIGNWQAANFIDVAPTTTTNYWAQWQANSGSCISNTTTTTVSVCIPVITQNPASVTIPSGSTTLSVVSNLPGSTYQWYIGASGTTTSPISLATAASVTVSPATTTSYWCRVSGPCGTVNSNTATVTICAQPAITHQPANSASNSGQFNSLSVTATGTNITYQWYLGASGDTSNPVGATTNTIQSSPTNSVQYWVKVTGTCGSVNSNSAWMSVAPGIIQQPQQTTYASQGSKGNLYVNATGMGLHYQWWGDSGPVSGAPDSPNFITPDITATASYYCIITSSGGAQTTSWAGTFFLCDGVPISTTTVTNAGGNCRFLISNIGGSYDSIAWYQGQRGDTSVQVGTGSFLNVCPSTSTTYWFRAFNTDSNLQVSCYADSAVTTVP